MGRDRCWSSFDLTDSETSSTFFQALSEYEPQISSLFVYQAPSSNPYFELRASIERLDGQGFTIIAKMDLSSNSSVGLDNF